LIQYGLEAEKLKVIYLGSQFDFENAETSPQYPRPYYLCVGALEKRKGQVMLCRAYLEALKHKPDLPDLLLAGPDRGEGAQIMELARQSDKIKRLSYLEKEKLRAFYQHADCLIFPSFYEGFGLPVVEAMKAGIPVLCSDIPPLREIAAGYADLVPPEENAFTKALLEENF
jgi:Glycosyltransferase